MILEVIHQKKCKIKKTIPKKWSQFEHKRIMTECFKMYSNTLHVQCTLCTKN